jgi:hypothetical protein
VSLPETSTSFDLTMGAQDAYAFTPTEAPPSGGPTIWQRLQNLQPGAWRELGDKNYDDAQTSAVSPVSYYWDDSGTVRSLTGWDFRSLDKMLSEAPAGTPKEVDEEIPFPLFYCPSGSWSSSSTGCNPSGAGALLDQTYGQLASFYANLVRYFRTGVITPGSGTSSYAADTLTDTAQNFSQDTGDCLTATVVDANGFPDWVTGTIASVGGAGDDTVTLTGNWSESKSFDAEDGVSIPSSTPVAGAAYNLASCTPPGGLSSPQGATPWPLPPSVGNVQYFELFNEPDLSNTNQFVSPPGVNAPSSITLTGVNVTGGTLTPGDTYAYSIAGDGIQATGVNCSSCQGAWTVPSSAQSVTLPSGDNAVQISWSAPAANDGALPYAYGIYGRTSGSQLGLAVVGRNAASGLTWTDTGAVTPSGSPKSTNESAGGNVITPASYYQMWNVVVPAMLAIDPTIKLNGPVESNASSYGEPSVDTACVTTNGFGSSCVNGDPGWSISTDYIPTLLKYANPLPNVVTFHGYGTSCCDTPETPNFTSISSYEIANYNSTDKAAIDAANIPVWIDEANYNANSAASNSYRSMTQVGSAWMADEELQWANADPHVQHILDWNANSGNPSWELFYQGSSMSGNTVCLPQPACQDLTPGEPDLEYWELYEYNHLFGGTGKLVSVSNVPSGFAAIAVQTSSTTVVVMLVNTQQGSDNGNGASGTANIQLQGASVTDTQRTTINGSTNMTNGPTTTDLGAQSNIAIDSTGYEVDLIKFTL